MRERYKLTLQIHSCFSFFRKTIIETKWATNISISFLKLSFQISSLPFLRQETLREVEKGVDEKTKMPHKLLLRRDRHSSLSSSSSPSSLALSIPPPTLTKFHHRPSPSFPSLMIDHTLNPARMQVRVYIHGSRRAHPPSTRKDRLTLKTLLSLHLSA